jgi:hypothetical protein
MTTRMKWVCTAIAVVVLLGFVAAVRLGGDEQASPVAIGMVEVDAPDRVPAGESIEVVVRSQGDRPPASEVTVHLHVISPWGTEQVSVVSFADRTLVRVPGDLTRRAGSLQLVAEIGGATGATSVLVVPGTAVDGAVPLAGPRSMIADGQDTTMVVALVRDQFGNAVVDGTELDILARRPDGTVDVLRANVEHLLAHVRLVSGTSSGRTTLRVAAPEGATGPEVEVLEVAGPPVAFGLVVADGAAPADGRTLVEIATDQLRDRFGNVVVDGTVVVFRTDGPTGVGSLNALTIDGRASVRLEAPDRPGVVSVSAHVGPVFSTVVNIAFEPDVTEFDVSVERVAAGVRVDVGPVTTSLGGFVPDGTEVEVLGAGRLLGTASIDRGRATIVVDAAPGDELLVDVLGERRTVVGP